jgi:hypothetical protein
MVSERLVVAKRRFRGFLGRGSLAQFFQTDGAEGVNDTGRSFDIPRGSLSYALDGPRSLQRPKGRDERVSAGFAGAGERRRGPCECGHRGVLMSVWVVVHSEPNELDVQHVVFGPTAATRSIQLVTA